MPTCASESPITPFTGDRGLESPARALLLDRYPIGVGISAPARNAQHSDDRDRLAALVGTGTIIRIIARRCDFRMKNAPSPGKPVPPFAERKLLTADCSTIPTRQLVAAPQRMVDRRRETWFGQGGQKNDEESGK